MSLSKRILALFLSISMLVSLCGTSAPAFAVEISSKTDVSDEISIFGSEGGPDLKENQSEPNGNVQGENLSDSGSGEDDSSEETDFWDYIPYDDFTGEISHDLIVVATSQIGFIEYTEEDQENTESSESGRLCFHNMYDDVRAGIQAAEEKDQLIEIVLPDGTGQQERISNSRSKLPLELPSDEIAEETPEEYREMPVKEMNGDLYVAILSIPELNLELPVRNEWSYERLTASPCRYTGSAYMKDLVICAHNYSQHFGRLKDLDEGSEILLVDMDGNLFIYRVALIETLMPTDIEKMLSSDYDLSLFTCTLGGRTRVTVRCVRQE